MLATIHEPDSGIALSYEEFKACRREETAFAQSGPGYTSSQCGYQARDPYATASELPGYPPPQRLIFDSERSNDAAYSPSWSAAGVKCLQDLSRESEATQALSLCSRTNGLGTRRPDPRDRNYPFSQGSLDSRVSPYSSAYTAGCEHPQYTSSSSSSRGAYGGQCPNPILCSSCQEQARKSARITLCSDCRSKIAPIAESSANGYGDVFSMITSLLVGVGLSVMSAEYIARNVVNSLRR